MNESGSKRELEDKKALVTGGSRGIGRAVCLELARRGADVAFIYHSRDIEARATAVEIRALGRVALALKTDLRMPTVSAWPSTAQRPNSDGSTYWYKRRRHGEMARGGELSTEDWDRYLAVDLSGAFYVIRAAVPHLRKTGGGAIVAISSIAAQMCQARNVQGAAAKAGLEAVVRVVAREEGRRGIRANAVAVGLTDTDMARTAFAEWGAESTERVVRGIPLRRIGTPEEVGARGLLLSPGRRRLHHRKVLQVDGGQIIAA
jgi:NAD(P)-dependent dehydrogenase (short-subunit alcohol dehydrogenase family)